MMGQASKKQFHAILRRAAERAEKANEERKQLPVELLYDNNADELVRAVADLDDELARMDG
jgi:hypothetical protein